jgi:hypothetical protein
LKSLISGFLSGPEAFSAGSADLGDGWRLMRTRWSAVFIGKSLSNLRGGFTPLFFIVFPDDS